MWQIRQILEEETRKIEGAMVEDNRFCVSVHFRHVHERVNISISLSIYMAYIYEPGTNIWIKVKEIN